MLLRGVIFKAFLTIVFVIVLVELFMYLKVIQENKSKPPKRYIKDYEALLCNEREPRNWSVNATAPCPMKGIITAFTHWELFTVMWQYANLIALSISTGLNPYLPFCMKDMLEKVFKKMPIRSLSEISHCDVPLPDSAVTIQTWKTPSQSIVIKTTDLYNDVVMEYMEAIRDHFLLNSALDDLARSFLLSAKQNRTNVTYIGVYITRTSIIVNQEFDNIYPSPQFFVDAMNYFRLKYPDAFFVTITDRKGFWEHFFRKQDVIVVDEESLKTFGSALAILSRCNHTILSSNDFAVWGAILSGGQAIVSTSLSENFYTLMQNRINWTYMLKDSNSVNKILERV